MELPLIDFSTVATATNNFCPSNMVGEGGFGPVYKVIQILITYISEQTYAQH